MPFLDIHDVPNNPRAQQRPVVVRVMGLGGGGQNAVDRMIEVGIDGNVTFIAANTDLQALRMSRARQRLLLGKSGHRGMGAGGDPERGRKAAEESSHEIRMALDGADMVFLTAGMGGGTGSGSIPVAAEIARELGILTVAVVTSPFSFEGTHRARRAEEAIARLKAVCNTVIVVPNDRLLELVPKMQFQTALRVADDVLRQGIQSIVELISKPGLVNVDFANVKRLLSLPGQAYMAIGNDKGDDAVRQAMHKALTNPLVEMTTVSDAAGVLMHFTGNNDLLIHDLQQATAEATRLASQEAEIVWGAANDDLMNDRVQVIVIMTGVQVQAARPVAQTPVVPKAVATEAPRERPAVPPPAPAPASAEALFGQAMRRPVGVSEARATGSEPVAVAVDMNNLDVPAFMRRRANGTQGTQAGA